MIIPLATAEFVNSAVNSSTQYRSDQAQYGRGEYWTPAVGAGDCEDFALAKRAMLLKLGAPLYALRLATCWTETGEYHAVLVVTTDDGEYVLQSLPGADGIVNRAAKALANRTAHLKNRSEAHDAALSQKATLDSPALNGTPWVWQEISTMLQY